MHLPPPLFPNDLLLNFAGLGGGHFLVLAVKGKEGAAYKVLFSGKARIYIHYTVYTGIFLGSVYGGEGYR